MQNQAYRFYPTIQPELYTDVLDFMSDDNEPDKPMFPIDKFDLPNQEDFQEARPRQQSNSRIRSAAAP
jgi:hypothetical protein